MWIVWIIQCNLNKILEFVIFMVDSEDNQILFYLEVIQIFVGSVFSCKH